MNARIKRAGLDGFYPTVSAPNRKGFANESWLSDTFGAEVSRL